ncbi:hypothetical protein KPL70_020998 [Citrus sinensis]|nr:hypothetical protein KPL70_020998 [Citrus sinensis]
MLGGLYGDLPPPSDEDKPTNTTTTVRSIFAPPQTILKPQSKPKTIQNSLPTRPHSSPAIAPSPDDVVALPQPALVDVTSTCQSDQKLLLIQMKNSFIFDVDSTPPAKISQWSESTDCCDWNGVDCDEAGHVIGLDLSAEPILIGSLENASGLFSLQYLQSLNLGFTLFYGFPMPSRLANLTNLTYLNLSHCGFTGEIPTEISSLPRSLLSGPINHHLANLRSLSVIRLRDNHAVSCQVPEFVANLLNLTTLDLSQCDLHGKIPKKGSLPHFPKNSSLRNLNLKNTSFSGTLPDSIGNLENLASVDVSSCNFTRLIPTSMANLTIAFSVCNKPLNP